MLGRHPYLFLVKENCYIIRFVAKEPESRVDYWLDRMQTDSKNLGEKQRLDLLKAVLINYCELTEEETTLFLGSELPSPFNPNHLLAYSISEKKVADYYNAASPSKNDPLYEKRLKQREGFIRNFRTALSDTYTDEELDDLLSYSTIHDDAFMAMKLFDANFPPFRRVRNAYLPGATTLTTADTNEFGGLTNVQESTFTLFDGDKDAVSQIKGLLGLQNSRK